MTKFKIQIFSLLLASTFTSICHGQTKTEHSNKTIEQFSFTSKNAKLTKTQGSDQYQQVACSIIDKEGTLWFGTTGEGVYRYNGKEFTQFTEKDGLCNNLIFMIFEDIYGDIWFGSRSAISVFDGEKFTTISIPNAEASTFSTISYKNEKNELWSMFQDKSGTVWLGTTNGIYCYDGAFFNFFLDDKSILNTSNVGLKWTQCIFEDKAGNIWFGSWVLANEGICRFDGKSITQYKPYGEGWVRSILEDKNGDLLISTRHNGVCRFDGDNFTNFTDKGGIQNGSINLIFKDKEGNLWMGTELGSGELNEDGGLWRYDGESFTRFTRKDGLCHNGVYSILQDTIGNLWVGSRNTDLCRFDGKTFTSFSE